jgi:hypothetical protein
MSWMALAAVLTGGAGVLGAIIALLTATHLGDDLDPVVPSMSLTFQACSLATRSRGCRGRWDSNLIGDHRRAERHRLALLERLALRVEVREVQRDAGELVDSDACTTISP